MPYCQTRRRKRLVWKSNLWLIYGSSRVGALFPALWPGFGLYGPMAVRLNFGRKSTRPGTLITLSFDLLRVGTAVVGLFPVVTPRIGKPRENQQVSRVRHSQPTGLPRHLFRVSRYGEAPHR